MLKFALNDPFPLVDERSHSEAEAREHSRQVDAWLGLEVREVESRLATLGSKKRAPRASDRHQQLWFGLDEQLLMTPYVEIRRLLDRLGLVPGDRVVDLGAAYGRMGFVVQRHHPGVDFVGYEYVGERVDEGRRCLRAKGCDRASLQHVDLTSQSFSLHAARVFFLYDYGTLPAIEKTLHALKKIALRQPLTVVGRGRHCRYAIETHHGWLQKADPLAGESRVTVYRSSETSGHALFGVEASV